MKSNPSGLIGKSGFAIGDAMTFQFDFSAAKQFLAYLDNQITLGEVFNHPAYQAVAQHAHFFGNKFSLTDVEEALQEKTSPFYGLSELNDRLPLVRNLMDFLDHHQIEWSGLIKNELQVVSPESNLDITIYPIIGYDMGIGFNGVVCMNLNYTKYLETPLEFLFYAVHECAHVLFERNHHIPPIKEVNSPSQWRSYFNLWTHNEGFAVYSALRLRERLGSLEERDYQVLFDPPRLETHRKAYVNYYLQLREEKKLHHEDYLEICFGDMRLTYRIGCELLRRVEHSYSSLAVREAFSLESDKFIERYIELLMD